MPKQTNSVVGVIGFVRSFSFAALAAIVALAIAAPAANAQDTEIKLITGFPLEGISGDKVYGAKLFIERFNAKAKGRAHIRVIGGPEVVAPFDQLKALQTGQFDAMLTTQAYFNEMRGLQFMNYLTGEEQVKGLANRGYETLQKASREGAGVVFVTIGNPGLPFYLWTREGKPVASVADAKGLKIRGLPGLNEQLTRQLGVIPTSLPSNDVYAGLRGGILDGAIRDSLSLEVLNEGEYAKNRTEMRLADFQSEIYLTAKMWDSLPTDIRDMMNTLARETEKETLDWMRQRVERTNKVLADKYKVKIVSGAPELNDILGRKIGGSLIKQIVEGSKYSGELIDRFALQRYLKD
jgi:TRAP-type C4-dicarboxylate transport system substrate-binding protein